MPLFDSLLELNFSYMTKSLVLWIFRTCTIQWSRWSIFNTIILVSISRWPRIIKGERVENSIVKLYIYNISLTIFGLHLRWLILLTLNPGCDHINCIPLVLVCCDSTFHILGSYPASACSQWSLSDTSMASWGLIFS